VYMPSVAANSPAAAAAAAAATYATKPSTFAPSTVSATQAAAYTAAAAAAAAANLGVGVGPSVASGTPTAASAGAVKSSAAFTTADVAGGSATATVGGGAGNTTRTVKNAAAAVAGVCGCACHVMLCTLLDSFTAFTAYPGPVYEVPVHLVQSSQKPMPGMRQACKRFTVTRTLFFVEHGSLNPKPQTPNPKPQTLILTPSLQIQKHHSAVPQRVRHQQDIAVVVQKAHT
jgi:hypothetical protein